MQAARQALRGMGRTAQQSLQKRNMSSHASQEESLAEMEKWKKVTYVALPVCLGYAIYCLSGNHDHHHERVDYSYLNIRMKEFPWGNCALFDGECWKQQALEKAQESEE